MSDAPKVSEVEVPQPNSQQRTDLSSERPIQPGPALTVEEERQCDRATD